jgi:PAS domain S-box-containing protein
MSTTVKRPTSEEMAEDRSSYVLRSVGAAVEAVLDARGEAPRLKRIFEHSPVPMVMVDGSRRYVEVNHSARLWFRLSLEEMRELAIGDLTPAPKGGFMEQAWAQLLDTGSNAGRYPAYAGDGSRLDLIYCGRANALPELHLIAFAPADWPEHNLDAIEDEPPDASATLTPREIDVLTLAANGLSGPDLARALGVSPSTVRTHFKNIHPKLGVRNRAAAVAKAIRLGVID